MKALKKFIDSVKKNKVINRFLRHKLARVGLIIFMLEVLIVLFAPTILHLDPLKLDYEAINQAPSMKHWFGTDELGRDMLARNIYGTRVSLLIGIASNIVAILIGMPLGLLAGYYRGIVESIIMRLCDIFMSIPSMVFMIVIASIFQPTAFIITMVIGCFTWTGYTRIIYSNVLSVRNMEYVEAGQTIGSKNIIIMFRDILPNSIAPLWIILSSSVGMAILMEASLSFIGVGIKAPDPSLGNIITSAQNLTTLTQRPWLWIPTGVILMVTVISINLFGDGIRDALDPKANI